jgi:hypothetical protein
MIELLECLGISPPIATTYCKLKLLGYECPNPTLQMLFHRPPGTHGTIRVDGGTQAIAIITLISMNPSPLTESIYVTLPMVLLEWLLAFFH